MDGVLCNFDKRFMELFSHREYDPRLFRQAVLDHKIFLDLEWMPHGKEIYNYVMSISRVKVEILSSTGTSEKTIRHEAMVQKQQWLYHHDIPLKANFSSSKREKAKWAHPRAILIDDREGCVEPFRLSGGRAILHRDEKWTETLDQLEETYTEIWTRDNLCGNIDT
jgi:hypothetical protein